MNLTQITDEILGLLKERGWHKPSAGSLAKSIVIESAELLEHFQWNDHCLEDMDPKRKEAAEDELADVMIYCLQLSKLMKSNPESIILRKLEKVRTKYPQTSVKNNPSKYHQIKQDHRDARSENT